jgi:hypothetical protein
VFLDYYESSPIALKVGDIAKNEDMLPELISSKMKVFFKILTILNPDFFKIVVVLSGNSMFNSPCKSL